MARKKKLLKNINENDATITATSTHENLQLHIKKKKRGSLDEQLIMQQQQEQQKPQYQSDGELMELKQKLHLEKNKSNLFLIKSYSFIDKAGSKKPNNINNNLNVKQKLQEFDKYHQALLMDQHSSVSKDQHKTKITTKTKQKEDNKNKEKDKEKDKDKPKKPPKLKKIKKSKTIYDSSENLPEVHQEHLRKPSIILEDDNENTAIATTTKPQSMPLTQNPHKMVTKSKTFDDLETPRLKRESFIRHSLQSIRRSFSTSKKHNNNPITFTSSSASSTSSNSSTNSDTNLRKSKDNSKDIGNLDDVEDSKYLIAEQEGDGEGEDPSNSSHLKPCNVVITLNDNETFEQPSSIEVFSSTTNALNSCTSTTASSSFTLQSSPASLHTMDASLAVLKEEDEKDLSSSCVNISIISNNNNNNPPCVISERRSTSSVSTLAQLPTDSSISPMAPQQTHTECQSVQCLNFLDKDWKSSSSATPTTTASTSSPPQIQKSKRSFQHQLSIPESLQSTSIGCATSSEYSSARSLKHSATSLTPLPTLNSSGSLRSISPSRRSASSNSSSTAKHEQQSTAAATAAAAATATTSNGSSTTTPPEKEKKRKEISSSRVKKFHRHFSQVSKDEKLINYFSCALVSDILLQGHLYITDQHFAFYSNVFGYVTKVVIPTSSVTKISKEKTAKIIPNAVGVATADERHVFGSFISREAAFRLMCSVCPPLGVPEILPKDTANIEISEEYSIEDDSSCSISGNESPAQATDLQKNSSNGQLLHHNNNNNSTSQTILRRSVGSSNLSIAETAADKLRHSDIPINAKTATITTTNTASSRSSAPPAAHYVNGANGAGGGVNLIGLKTVLQQQQQQPAVTLPLTEAEVGKLTIIAGCASNTNSTTTATTSTTSATSTPTPSTSSSPTTVMTLPSSKANRVFHILRSVSSKLRVHVKFPTEIHVVYLGVMLTLLLALFSIFLLYRILDIEAKANGYRSPVEFNWRSGNDDDIFSEALRFQKQLQLKSTEEAQNILKTNLEQIAKVRRSLETLSMLIHDRSSSVVSTHTDDSD